MKEMYQSDSFPSIQAGIIYLGKKDMNKKTV